MDNVLVVEDFYHQTGNLGDGEKREYIDVVPFGAVIVGAGTNLESS
jgi:hypothetical protein